MVVQSSPIGYRLDIGPTEREALLVALEYTVGARRGDHGTALRGLLSDVDADQLDRLADRLFLVGAAS
jgi:hypothetical protein